MLKNKNLMIVALVAVVNALGYGIIIPVIYTYSKNFGLSDFSNGLLFATFSLFQFISTPFIGRLSDKYGRRPLLLISISGTAISFLIMALAKNPFWLFAARALDGITAGNVPVASAVISDSTEVQDRARGFGIIGASFGFGFVFGPAISAFTSGYGLAVPFYIAAIVSLVAVVLVALFLPETNKHLGEVKKGKIIDIKKLLVSIIDPNIGKTLLLTLVYTFAFAMFQYAFQPLAVKQFAFTPSQIGQMLTVFGVLGILCQLFIIPQTVKKFGEKSAINFALTLGLLSFIALAALAYSPLIFIISATSFHLGNSFVAPIIQTLLSREVDSKSQGSILGLNSSYASISLILGPVIGGFLSNYSPHYPFYLGALVLGICIYISYHLFISKIKPISEFS